MDEVAVKMIMTAIHAMIELQRFEKNSVHLQMRRNFERWVFVVTRRKFHPMAGPVIDEENMGHE
jgi:hypothetical protein